MIYLASPYTHPDLKVVEERFKAVCAVSSEIMRRNIELFSPIAHTHPIAMAGGLPTDWDFWKRFDEWFIQRCDQLWVLMLDGWRNSKGVAAEIEIASAYRKPVRYLTEEEAVNACV